ncbi:MAG TPA: helix-turn-helix domain-containing protein [Kofleriaceae bacterium]|jgi:AcrR family transcriptional regulator|nr:helix-turn-helix domain-containing protein [Kofleriaceae bacterium]
MAVKRPKPRVRRSPEEARTHILDAADAVFRDHLPDAVGLREIAVAAGVSHGLVTHYPDPAPK